MTRVTGLLLAALAEGLTTNLRRALLRQQLRLAALATALLALAFLAVAWDLWLATRLGQAGAAAVTGLMLAVAALMLFLVARTLRGAWRGMLPGAATPEALAAELQRLAPPLTIIAAILGFLLARAPGREGGAGE